MNEREIFNSARHIAADERNAYLKQACAGDTEMRARVDELLRAHDLAGSFLHAPAVAAWSPTVGERPVNESPGTVIGPYRLLEQIGEGGFGVVFMAEQTTPVKRKVALKVIKPGMDTREVIARFEAERQALALMDHPNIAKVFDAGTTESGRPFFVMELVKGVPITEYCDQSRLSPKQRLELFVTVCHAVQHAHQKGIIHRDIKPTNVLVTRHDDRPVVKVIDFGVAKATSGQLTDKTLFTGFAQMIGTPLYMSPEQAAFSSLDVDTRSDIYALGVLLYELLTGLTPFDRARLHGAAFDEIRRIIREEEPVKPSTRLSHLGRSGLTQTAGKNGAPPQTASARSLHTASLASIAAQRHTEPDKLSHLMRGDLDWIVMKALEKNRTRRYETANALAIDVLHYLADEPVCACPPSNWYRFRKLVKRNRGVSASVTGILLVVLMVVVLLAVSNSRIRQEQARTRVEKDRADHERLLAEDRADEIRQGLERLKAANGWLERGQGSADIQQWDDANAAYSKAVALRPDHAAAWVERGDQFAWLGLWDLASADFTREFELREPDAPMRWYRHALMRLWLDDVEGYRGVRDRMREQFRGTLHEPFAMELVRTCVLGSDCDEVERLVQLAQQGADGSPGAWYELYVLGIAQYRAGHFEQAALRLQESLTGTPDWQVREISYPVLAMARYRLGETTEAREALESAAGSIERWTAELYQNPAGRAWVVHQGAGPAWPIAWWDWLECRHFYREAKLMIDGVPPPDDPRLQVLRARAFAGLRRNFTADDEYAAVLRSRPDDPQLLTEAHRSAGYSAVGRGQWRTAAAEFTAACELQPDDSYLWRYRAVACLATGDLDAYRQACQGVLEHFETTDDPETAGNVLLVCTLRDDALTDNSRLLPLTRISERMWHWGAWAHGAALYRTGRFEESVRCFETAAVLYRPRAWDWCFQAMAHHRLGHVDEARRCLVEAKLWIDEANRQGDEGQAFAGQSWGNWHEPVVYPILLREAEELLKTAPPSGSK